MLPALKRGMPLLCRTAMLLLQGRSDADLLLCCPALQGPVPRHSLPL